MIEISTEEAALCMRGLVEGRKNLRDQATEFLAMKRTALNTENHKEAEDHRKAALRCEQEANAMNDLLNSLVERDQ